MVRREGRRECLKSFGVSPQRVPHEIPPRSVKWRRSALRVRGIVGLPQEDFKEKRAFSNPDIGSFPMSAKNYTGKSGFLQAVFHVSPESYSFRKELGEKKPPGEAHKRVSPGGGWCEA
jgi:hypothetical protein